MDALFDGEAIFGTQTRVIGPVPRPNAQREKLPGIPGYRVYNLGTEAVSWHVRGLLMADTIPHLEDALFLGAGYMDSGLYTFTTTGGSAFAGCLLLGFQQEGFVQSIRVQVGAAWVDRFCVFVNATVEWTQPEW